YIPSSVSSNIKVVNWIPKNDLDIKAFVSHNGTNSYYESAYHGVPVVAVPLFLDQFSNARKAEYFGIATVLDHKTMDAEKLFKAIELVMNEPSYFQKSIATLIQGNSHAHFSSDERQSTDSPKESWID
ncbi:hypothetical protein pdam_00009211, partial [Pocillopora damicornis]